MINLIGGKNKTSHILYLILAIICCCYYFSSLIVSVLPSINNRPIYKNNTNDTSSLAYRLYNSKLQYLKN